MPQQCNRDKIAERACMLLQIPKLSVILDLEAAKMSGCELDLERLSKATDKDFLHDIVGIHNNLDRQNFRFLNNFWPRHAKK